MYNNKILHWYRRYRRTREKPCVSYIVVLAGQEEKKLTHTTLCTLVCNVRRLKMSVYNMYVYARAARATDSRRYTLLCYKLYNE